MTEKTRTRNRAVVEAIRATLSTAQGMERTGAHETLTESPVDLPLLLVYSESGAGNASGRTDRTTFSGGIRTNTLAVRADLYVKERSIFGEEMALLEDLLDAIIDRIWEQNARPLFGCDGIDTFAWRWERVTFVEGDGPGAVRYTGARFTFDIKTR